MADLTARFRILDMMSDTMEHIAQAGSSMAERLGRAGDTAGGAFDGISGTARSAASTVDGIAVSIDSLQDAADSASSSADGLSGTISGFGDAAEAAAGQADGLAESAERAARGAEDSGRRGQEAAEKLSSALTAAGIGKIVTEIAGAFMEASAAAAEFEVATMKISTIADTAQVPLSQISADIVSLSRETGIGVSELSEAAYSAISASVSTADAVQFTATASKLAAGGFTSSATAVDVLTTALNAYKLEAGYAENISDMLITTQNLGKTTVDELAASVGKVIPLASAYGVEMDSLSAAYAELTKGGIATAEAGTYLKSMLNELGDSGSTVSAVLLEQTGSSFAQLTEQGYSLGDVMAVLGESVGGNAGAFNELWSSSEAGIGALSLYNAGAEQFNATLGAMRNSAGATEAAYSAMTDTAADAQEELSNAAENLQIAIGQNINPLVEKLYGLGTDIFNGMSQFAQEHPVISKIISAAAIGLGAVAVSMIAVTTATTVAIPAVSAFGAALSAALGPAGWVALAITGIAAAGASLAAMLSDMGDETAGMTAATREQYYGLQDLNAEYEEACEKYGETSEEASRLRYQVDGLSEAFEANRQTVEEFAAEADALCGSVSQVTGDFNDGMEAIRNNESASLALIQKYEDLSEQAALTGAQEKELEAVTKELAKSYPELAAQLDGAALSAEGYAEAMKKACEQRAEEQRQAQAQETYIEALQKQAELENEIAKAEANLNAEREAHGMYYDEQLKLWTNGWYTEGSPLAGWTTDLDEYSDALARLTAAQAENDATIARIEQGWEDISAAEQAAAEEAVSWEDASEAAFGNVRDRVAALCGAYGEAYSAAAESFEGQFGLFETADMKSEEYLESTVKNAQKALDSQLAYWEAYQSDVEVLKGTSAEDLGITKENYEALMEYAQGGSEQAAGLAKSMAQAIQKGDTEAVAALADTLGEVNARKEEIAAATADWVTDFSAQMDEVEKEMQSAIDGMKLDTEAARNAEATISAYAEAIRAGKAGAVTAAEEVSDAVAAAFSAARTGVSVRVSSSGGTVPGHADGTTDAEGLFLAGERGPELVARPAAAYAGGTTDSTDFFIAGEDGPELIAGERGSTVFPTEETDRLISALNDRRRPLQVQAVTGAAEGGRESRTEQVKRILLEISGSGAIEVGGGGGGADKETILEVLYGHLKPVLMNLIQGEIYEEGDYSYEY